MKLFMLLVFLSLLAAIHSMQHQMISSGNGFQSAIINQQVYVWGREGRIGDGTDSVARTIGVPIDHTGVWAQTRVIALSSGMDHVVALEQSGKVYSWGDNTYGQIGDGSMGEEFTRFIPTQVNQTTGALAGKEVKQVAAGGYHSLVLTTGNQLFAWGYGLNGNLGDNGAQNQGNPVQVNTTLLNGQQITQITAGHYHSLLLTNDGTIYSWGGATGPDNRGQLGNGATNPVGIPSPINMTGAMSGKQAVKIRAGASFSLALTSDGFLFAWGDNSNGQLGIENPDHQPIPMQVNMTDILSGNSITQIATGYSHCLVLTSNNQLIAWGKNTNGELGDGTYIDALSPIAMNMSEFRGRNISQITAGLNSLVLTSDDALFTWGPNTNSQIGDGTTSTGVRPTMVGLLPFTPIMAGGYHSMALSTSKSTYRQLLSWGNNDYGQLGDATNISRRVATFGTLNGTKIVHLAAGEYHSLAITSDGALFAWGRNSDGQLGDGTTVSRPMGVPVPNPPRSVWAQISAGNNHTLGIDSKGKVYSWGTNTDGQIGGGPTGIQYLSPSSQDTMPTPRIMQVAAGSYHSLALTFEGQIYSWGKNDYGQLGINSTSLNSLLPELIDRPDLVAIKIAAGGYHSMLVTSDGHVYGWGQNDVGQLGIPGVENQPTPVIVPVPISPGTMIRCGAKHTLALVNGIAYGWGQNSEGQLGDNSYISRNSPERVGEIPEPSYVVTGGMHSLLATTSTVHGFGLNTFGQLGDQTLNNKNFPTQSLCSAGYAASWLCALCPAGQYSMTGALNCTSCPAGQYSGEGVSSCTNCSTGQYSIGGSATCDSCPAGQYSGEGASNCTDCDPGTFSPTPNSSACKLCPPGNYSSTSRAIACDGCPIGTASDVAGSPTISACKICPIDSHAPLPGSTICVPCPPNYAGYQCVLPFCHLILANETWVCSSHGNCTAPDTCTCSSGYTGSNCTIPMCYSKNTTALDVCSGHGNCIGPDTCSCNAGWTSSECKIPICFNLSANTSGVCSGNGMCVAPNNCTCNTGFTEGQCAEPICFGMNQSNPQVCSGRGRCNGPDLCVCSTGYYGYNCQLFDCFGTLFNSSYVCSQHGNCTNYNSCSCDNGWADNQCQTPICFGINGTDKNVCSSHGNCTLPDSCICNNDYSGTNCRVPNCFNITATDPTVCSSNGSCVELNHCTCNDGYTGSNCQTPICFKVSSSLNTVCSSNGTCIKANTCVCNSGFYGEQCQFYDCFGSKSADPLTCSGYGSCVNPNTCTCNSGWTGNNCSIPICFGITALNNTVCTGRGKCVAPDTCKCIPQYIGDPKCGHPVCFGKIYDNIMMCSGHGLCIEPELCNCSSGWNSSVDCSLFECNTLKNCSKHGICAGPNNCSCDNNWIGSDCNTPICFDVNATSSLVCSGHGQCNSPNICNCSTNYIGTICNIPVCYSRNSTDPLVCSGKGSCVAPNQCSCLTGYHGAKCEIISCGGIISTNASVCNGKGNCSSPDNCVCSSGYGGFTCDQVTCNNISASDSSVCSGHGACISSNKCICNYGYNGINCEMVNAPTTCFGKNTSDPLVCNGKGRCIALDICVCNANSTTGYWSGASCTICSPGWKAPSCTTNVGNSFKFTATGAALEGSFFTPNYGISVDCSLVLHQTTMQQLGTNPRCFWPDPSATPLRFQIVFGQSPTFSISNSLLFLPGLTIVNVLPPESPILPVAYLVAPSTVGSCDDIGLDGSLSTSSDGRKLTYSWQAIPTNGTPNIEDLNHFLAPQNASRLIVPNTLMDAGFSYSIQLTVINYFGFKANASKLITKINTPTPIAKIRGSPEQISSVSKFFMVEGMAEIPACFSYDNKELVYTWKQTSGAPVAPVIKGRFLTFPSFTFQKSTRQQSYKFELKVQPTANMLLSSIASVALTIVPEALIPHITGGAKRQVSTNNSLILDCSNSEDPDSIGNQSRCDWTCFTSTGVLCSFNNNFRLSSGQQITIPPFSLNEGIYNFSLIFNKDSRSAQTYQIVQFDRSTIPEVQITTLLPSRVNTHVRLVVSAKVVIPTVIPSSLVSTRWNIYSSNGSLVTLSANQLLTSLSDTNLVIAPFVLLPMEHYSFEFLVTFPTFYTTNAARKVRDTAQEYSVAATTEITIVNAPPSPGAFIVSPTQGKSFATNFELICTQWNDEDTPLTYSFGYLRDDGSFVTLVLPTQSNQATIHLPAGSSLNKYQLIVQAKIIDKYGAIATANATVIVNTTTQDTTSLSSSVSKQLQSALANANTEQVVQLVNNVGQYLMFTGIQNVSLTQHCPNDCSSHGSCVVSNLSCVCYDNYVTKDCSLTVQELTQRQQMRQDLISALAQSFNQSVAPITASFIAQQANALSSITTSPVELTPAAKSQAADLLSNMLSPNIPLDDTTATTISSVVSNLATAIFEPPNPNQPGGSSASQNMKLAADIAKVIDSLLSITMSNRVPGETPLQIVQPGLSLLATSQLPNKLNNLGLTAEKLGSKPAKVSFPNDLSNQLGTTLDSSTVFQVQMVSYNGNPYAWSDSSRNISASVLTVNLKTELGYAVKVKDIKTPIVFTIPATMTQYPLQTSNDQCILEPTYVPSCQYWDGTTEKWSSNGCQRTSVQRDQIVCACNHLTDFSGMVNYIIPDMNILEPEDLKLIVKLNVDNMTVVIIMASLVALYIILLIVTFTIDRWYDLKKEFKMDILSQRAKSGHFRYFIELILIKHAWLSIFWRPSTKRTFTRSRRLTIVMVIIVNILGMSALFYQTNQSNLLRTIMAGIISALFTVIPARTLSIIFSFIDPWPRNNRKIQATPNHMFEESNFEKQEYYIQNMKIQNNPEEIELVDQKISNESTDAVVPDPPLTPIQNEKQDSQASELDKRRSNRKEILRMEDHISRTNGEKKYFTSKLAEGALNKVDDLMDQAEIKLKQLIFSKVGFNFTPVAIIVTLVLLTCYFAIIGAVVLIMELLFKDLGWRSYFSTLLCLVSVLIIVIVFMFMYFDEKKKMFQNTLHWDINKKTMIFAAIVIVFSIIAFVVTFAVASGFHSSLGEGWYHIIIVGVFWICIALLATIFIVRTVRKPKIVSTKIRSTKRTRAPLPYWFQFIVFPLAWAYMGIWIYLLIIYGIKFGPEKQRNWLLATFFGIAQDNVLTNPVKILAKILIATFVLHLISMLFFDPLTAQRISGVI